MAVLHIVTFLLGIFAFGQVTPTNYCAIYTPINPDHTMCHPLNGEAVSAADKATILTKHNEARSVAKAANMLNMTWDADLAELAQRWVNTCPGGHEVQNYDRYMFGFYTVGQNYAGTSSATDTWGKMVDLWINERDDYTYTSNSCAAGKKCGHYTQVVWAKSHKVGCAAAACPNYSDNAGKFQFICNYAPGGNSNNESPYVDGGSSPASDCETKVSGKNLCDCSGQICRNNAQLDVKTCKCTCDGYGLQLKTHVGEECATDCSKALTDMPLCGGDGWELSKCKTNSNQWAIYCPNLCKVCPAIKLLP